MISGKTLLLLTTVTVVAARPVGSAERQQATVEEWQRYVRDAGTRMQAPLNAEKPFLWIDEAQDRRVRLKPGQIVVAPVAGQGMRKLRTG